MVRMFRSAQRNYFRGSPRRHALVTRCNKNVLIIGEAP
jgi:hypothetical protein